MRHRFELFPKNNINNSILVTRNSILDTRNSILNNG